MADDQQRLVSCVLRLIHSFINALKTTKSMEDLQKSFTTLSEYFNKLASKSTLQLIDSQKQQVLTMCSKLEELESLIEKDYLSIVPELSNRKLLKTIDLVSTSNVDLFIVLGSFYSCFSNFIMRKLSSSSLNLQSDLTVGNKAALIDELMTAASDDVVRQLVEEDLPYDKYYTHSVIIRLQAPEQSRDSYTQQTRRVIDEVAVSYAIPTNMLIDYIYRKSTTYVRSDLEVITLLLGHIPKSSEEKVPSFEEFLSKSGLRHLWGSEEVDSFSTIFEKYAKKVQRGDLRDKTVEKHAKQIAANETASFRTQEVPYIIEDPKLDQESKLSQEISKTLGIPLQPEHDFLCDPGRFTTEDDLLQCAPPSLLYATPVRLAPGLYIPTLPTSQCDTGKIK